MKLLALSDIHNNVATVYRLRERESNEYEALIVAGDFGNDSAVEIMAILETFRCPVLYVLGNWDHQIEYRKTFGLNFHHLHHAHFTLEGWSFTGFSGVPVNWGKNPIAADLQTQVKQKHGKIVKDLVDLERTVEMNCNAITEACEKTIAALDASTKDRRRLSYRKKADAIRLKNAREIYKARRSVELLKEGVAWKAYQEDEWCVSINALARNRAALAAIVLACGPRRTVVVTHERLARTNVDMCNVPLFLFGHVHGYSDTICRSQRFVNVSVLDDKFSPGPFGNAGPAARARMGTYTQISIDARGVITSKCCRLES